jgi:hypothetical protein
VPASSNRLKKLIFTGFAPYPTPSTGESVANLTFGGNAGNLDPCYDGCVTRHLDYSRSKRTKSISAPFLDFSLWDRSTTRHFDILQNILDSVADEAYFDARRNDKEADAMDQKRAIAALGALAQDTRLDCFGCSSHADLRGCPLA